MYEVNKQLDKDEILMASALLLFATYYPDYPPLKSFSNISFQGRRDSIVLVENCALIFTDVENCSQEQIKFFETKLKEIPEFSGSIAKMKNNFTRIYIFPSGQNWYDSSL